MENLKFIQTETVKENIEISLNEVQIIPLPLVTRLKDNLSMLPYVKEVYLLDMVKEGKESFLFVVTFENNELNEEAFNVIGQLAEGFVEKPIYMLPSNEDVIKDYIKTIRPFYIAK